MNIHHLELFYYVARFKGISEAVRNIPYGIQQPAVSAQVIQLEDDLGLTLFHRRPFALTKAGEELYEFIKPFFGNVEAMAERLRGGLGQVIRIGASEIVQRDHLPEIVLNVRKQFTQLKLFLREGYQPKGKAAVVIDALRKRGPMTSMELSRVTGIHPRFYRHALRAPLKHKLIVELARGPIVWGAA